MSELSDKIAKIIYDNSEYGWEKSAADTVDEIAELLEAEKAKTKPASEGLTERIEDIITGEWGDNRSMSEIAAEIAAMFEAERQPDTLTVPEAVERLVAYFEKWFIHAIYGKNCNTWDVVTHTMDKGKPPDWVNAIINGNNSPAAVKVGLEDLFVTILGGEK